MLSEERLGVRLQDLPRRVAHYDVEAAALAVKDVGELEFPVEEAVRLGDSFKTAAQRDAAAEAKAGDRKAAAVEQADLELLKEKRMAFVAQIEPIWESADQTERAEILQLSKQKNPFAKSGSWDCLVELANRRGIELPETPEPQPTE